MQEEAGISSILLIILPLFGGILFLVPRRLRTRILQEQDLDEIPFPIIYLRPFKKDSSIFRQSLAAGFLPPWFLSRFLVSIEEGLARALQPLGSLVAIGKPGKKLPGAGASKLYVGDDWKIKVTKLLQKGKFIIIHPGRSEGIMWEVGKAVEVVDPKKFIIYLGSVSSKRKYNSFARMMKNHTNILIPPYSNKKGKFQGSLGFLGFDENWNGFFLFQKPPFFRQGPNAQENFFNYSLKSLFDRAGVDWCPPPVSKYQIFATIIAILIIIFLVSLPIMYLVIS